ncbi:hypothetical protein PS273GM_01475 [Stutzerimonas stutzeri]|jgi:hypothetical protein|uniref:Uncharacterized protein n=1 Tax=Stutzerimonas stutzeri TaxID=316 RepID=A0A172WKQ0_STUST|nr:hypothetical protein PS273GM_01475 [Stutzerimonas stutzeri]
MAAAPVKDWIVGSVVESGGRCNRKLGRMLDSFDQGGLIGPPVAEQANAIGRLLLQMVRPYRTNSTR